MNKNILIITPYFAPQSHAAVFRAYKLAKYLPQFGWKPYVITTDTNYIYNEDPHLTDALPPEVEIHRTRYVEPSIRGLRMAMGGQNRSFNALKTTVDLFDQPKYSGLPIKTATRALVQGVYQYLVDNWLRNPDAYWTWEYPTVRKAIELIEGHQISVVLTSADPYTTHRIGYQIKKATGIRWIADFRDPHTHSYWKHSRNQRIFKNQRKAEQFAVSDADAISVAAESIALILTETYGLENTHPISFIPTGLDRELLVNATVPQDIHCPYLLFTGEFLASYGDLFFRVFALALTDAKVKATGIKLVFIGRQDVNVGHLTPLVRKHGIQDSIIFIDHMPQGQLYSYLLGAKAALLIPGSRANWWCLYAKLVDYLALQKPTVAIVPDPSEARRHLQRSGLGIFLDGSEDKMVALLCEFILSNTNKLPVDPSYCEQFIADSQVKAFVELLENDIVVS